MALTIGYLISGRGVVGWFVSPGPGVALYEEFFLDEKKALDAMARGSGSTSNKTCQCHKTMEKCAAFVYYRPGFIGNTATAHKWDVLVCADPACRVMVNPTKLEKIIPVRTAMELTNHKKASVDDGDLVFLDGDNDERLPTIAKYIGQTGGNTGVIVQIGKYVLKDYQYYWRRADNFCLFPMPQG